MNQAAEFFDATKKSCEEKSADWENRKTLRAEELAGVDKALEILDNDDARALFKASIKPGQETASSDGGHNDLTFLQVDSEKTPAGKAYKALQNAAKKSSSVRIAAI